MTRAPIGSLIRMLYMFRSLFESEYARQKDRIEVGYLREQYGEAVKTIILDRANDATLSKRDRKHWHRIAHKI